MTKKVPPILGDTTSAKLAKKITEFSSLIPVYGVVSQQILTEIIPNTRVDRIEEYLLYLANRIRDTELESLLQTIEGQSIFEEGIRQAAQAHTKKRKEDIANLVLKGLVSEEDDQITARHFLRLLNQLDDRQIIILSDYHPENKPSDGNDIGVEFYKTHKDTLHPGEKVKGFDDHEGQEKARKMGNLNASMRNHLESFGLLDKTDDISRQGKQPANRGFHITQFGKEFLSFLKKD